LGGRHQKLPPVLVKTPAKALSPDDLKQTIEVLMARKVVGVNATNEVAYEL